MLQIRTAILTLIVLSLGGRVAWSDDPPTKPAQNKSDLTEGLMELLREPAKDKSNKPSGNQPSIEPIPANPQNKPGMDGEDLGQGPASPLADIQLEMSTLAGWMRGKADVSRTKELQRNIVLRLDEMIEQLEKQSSSQSNAASSHLAQLIAKFIRPKSIIRAVRCAVHQWSATTCEFRSCQQQ